MLLYFFENLLVDSMFDAPYFSGRLRRSSVPSETAEEGMTSYLLLSAFKFSSTQNAQGCRDSVRGRFQPKCEGLSV